ncbi:MAG: hypothetical protein ABJ111_11945 [Alphaproteobacteria bacterium]
MYGDGSAGNLFTSLGRLVSKIMTNRAVPSWDNPTTLLWQIFGGGYPASMQRAAVQGNVGASVNVSAGVHGVLEALDDLNFLAFSPLGGAGIAVPLAQHLNILGHAIITIASRGLP